MSDKLAELDDLVLSRMCDACGEDVGASVTQTLSGQYVMIRITPCGNCLTGLVDRACAALREDMEAAIKEMQGP